MMQRPRQKTNIFGFFWHDEFEIETMDTPDEVRAKLEQIVGEVPVFEPFRALKRALTRSTPTPTAIRPFVGTITDEAFQFQLYPAGRRTERIHVRGTVHASGTGASLVVQIKMNPVRALLMSGTSLMMLLILGFVLLTTLMGGAQLHPSYYIFPAGLALMTYLIATMGFWDAATIAKNAILKALR